MKDIEKDLIENDPSEGFETDIDIHKSDEAENDPFETIAPQKDNPARREFEIGQLGQEELREDERARDATAHDASRNTKPSQRKFNRYNLSQTLSLILPSLKFIPHQM